VTVPLEKNVAVAFDRERFERLAASHYENFPVGSWLAPKRLRPHIHRIYAFARTADDLADENGGDREGLLAFRAAFLAHEPAAAGAPDSAARVPLFDDLWRTIGELDLPKDLFLALLDAFEQDLDVRRYADEAQLHDYCRRSADPVGRLVLRVFGYRDPALDALSDRVCTGLQLLNHLQDLRADLIERDRLYFPRSELERFGVTEDDLKREVATPGVRAFVESEARKVAAMFDDGWPLVLEVGGRLRLELRAILGGAAAVLRRMRATGFDPLGGRVHLNKFEKIGALARAFSPFEPRVFGQLATPGIDDPAWIGAAAHEIGRRDRRTEAVAE
jgi:squalene synthase HpnC